MKHSLSLAAALFAVMALSAPLSHAGIWECVGRLREAVMDGVQIATEGSHQKLTHKQTRESLEAARGRPVSAEEVEAEWQSHYFDDRF